MFSKLTVLPKSLLIGFVAIAISTLGIQASDELSGVSGKLTSLVLDSQTVCGPHEVLVLYGTHSLCMDTFEAGPASQCPKVVIGNEVDTQLNIAVSGCKAESKPHVMPWRHVTYTEAKQLCARAGKRLPTNEEWYKVSLGIENVEKCFGNNVQLKLTGVNNCVTATGVHDVVGNVWEWMEDTVTEGLYKNRSLPESGYVSLVDQDGIVLETSDDPNNSFGKDYAWVDQTGVQGIIRGGFYGSETDGGVFAQNLAVPLNFSAVGVGFRCVRDIL